MKLFVLGGTGMIGSRIVTEALSRGHDVTIGSRSPETSAPQDGVTAVRVALDDTAALAAQAEAADVTITAVSPRSTGDAIAESNAYADALIAALGQNRVVVVGGAGSLNLPDGSPVADVVPEAYRSEAQGMRQAYEKIAASDLNYTVMAPAGLIEPGERTGTFRLGGRQFMTDEEGNSRISAEDFAVALLDEVETPQHSRQIFHAAY
ncbi:NAD(P)H-binding protein [Tritonibacter sp. AK171]|uniref:NAD(P)-dependent oxidoreductase n=1 Tax=Tritonibacter sp. AK171 TaxID=3048493 RepID=UPI0024C296D7|nr:NAD(P)H-binding protein [Tritonibacter sp. AK171]